MCFLKDLLFAFLFRDYPREVQLIDVLLRQSGDEKYKNFVVINKVCSGDDRSG